MCLFYKDAFAAVPSSPPFLVPGQGLDAQAERFRQEYSVEKRARERAITKALIECEEEQNAPVAPGVVFTLRSVHLTGATIFDPQNLSFIWKPYLNKKVDFRDLNDIVKMIKRAYKDLGYLTTSAYMPPQDVKDGVVEVSVVEGKRGKLTVDGNKWVSTPGIEKYFHTYKGEVLDMGEMERDVMRMNENRDLKVGSVLSTGENPETVDVTLKTQDSSPYHVTVGTDNQGSRLSGRFRRIINMDDSNLTGNLDNLSINTDYTDLSSGEFVSYQTPVGTHGTKLGLDAGYFQGKLGQEYKPYDITNFTETLNPNASFELYETQSTQLDLRTGMQVKYNEKKESTHKDTDEALRLPYMALDAIKTDPWGQTSFSPEVSISTPGFLGASKSSNVLASRSGADAYFAKYEHYLNRTQYMPWGSYMQIRSQFQTATHSLPTSEQLQLGGANSIRGYPEGDYLADIGGDLSASWYFPMYLIPQSWQFYGTALRNDIEPFIFYDMGGGELITVNSSESKKAFLSGTGAGVKFHLKGNMYLKMEWAIATGDKPVHGTGPSTFDVSFQAGV